jgi:hypothetical protein
MHFAKTAAAAFALASVTLAAPTAVKRQAYNESGISDADILNYALTLEHLEATFYKEGLDMYNSGAFDKAGL